MRTLSQKAGGFFVEFHSKCSEEFSRIFISVVETVLDTRYQTAESARIFISEAETVLATRNQTTESARFFISWDGFFLRN